MPTSLSLNPSRTSQPRDPSIRRARVSRNHRRSHAALLRRFGINVERLVVDASLDLELPDRLDRVRGFLNVGGHRASRLKGSSSIHRPFPLSAEDEARWELVNL